MNITGSQLRLIRTRFGPSLTIKVSAAMVDVHYQTWARWERDHSSTANSAIVRDYVRQKCDMIGKNMEHYSPMAQFLDNPEQFINKLANRLSIQWRK